ncbi:MAG: FKBP-type peptidyl-prolyl cis-trans isomerase [Actinomycetales bacterium]|nr:FKBP-type peptidyl-prolyl cis-trans isomerase [Candidatus Phosphoribacter baldrii]
MGPHGARGPDDDGEPTAHRRNGCDHQGRRPRRVHYTGVLWKDGSVFDSSWTRGRVLVQVGTRRASSRPGTRASSVRRPGLRVLLVVPPADGYSAAGSPPKISGTDTLVFVVDILAVS